MQKFRITIETDGGDILSWKDEYDDEYVQFGEWTAPFPNEVDDSFAFGVIECFWQSDNVPSSFYEQKIVKVICERIK